MKRVLVALGVLLVVQAGFLAAFLWFGRDQESRRASTVTVVAEEEIALPFPDVTLEYADGRREPFPRDKPVVVHLWGTWCPPCVEELPRILERSASTDDAFVAVAIDDDWDALRKFFGGTPPATIAIVSDSDFPRNVGVTSLPQTLYVDGEATVRRRWSGARDWSGADWKRLTAPIQ